MSTNASIPTRQLGRDGPTIPIQGLGLMGLSCKSKTSARMTNLEQT